MIRECYLPGGKVKHYTIDRLKTFCGKKTGQKKRKGKFYCVSCLRIYLKTETFKMRQTIIEEGRGK